MIAIGQKTIIVGSSPATSLPSGGQTPKRSDIASGTPWVIIIAATIQRRPLR
jgi:hypothetical protein